MSTDNAFQFIVTVEVENWPEGTDEYSRTAKDYAKAALSVAGLRDAAVLDGFADLHATADIDYVDDL